MSFPFQKFFTASATPWCVAVLLHACGAYFSFGYHHPDEHFQIWEWANYFVGLNQNSSTLPWEFAAQIRPWFQPLIHAGIIKFFLTFNIFNSFDCAFFTRELYSAVNLLALYSLWKSFQARFFNLTTSTAIFPWTVAVLWFFPYIHCRTSSENLAGIFLTFAFAKLLHPLKNATRSSWFLTGLLFGFAFLSRYQIALGLLGLALYLLIKDKKIILNHILMLTGFVLVVIFGTVLDRIGYGTWVFTPYTYFDVNLIKGVAATFNPYPWYQYILWLLLLNPFVTLPIFYGIYLYARKVKMDPLLAFTAAFCLIQFYITNKEYRFLFPIFNFIPYFIAAGWRSYSPKIWAMINLPGVFATGFRAISLGIWPVLAFHQFYNPSLNPSQHWITNQDFSSVVYYQMPKSLHYESFEEIESLKKLFEKSESPIWILLNDLPAHSTFEEMFEYIEARCERVETSIPYFIFNYRNDYPIIKRLPYQSVYSCKK